jgi:glycine cleavage system H protein
VTLRKRGTMQQKYLPSHEWARVEGGHVIIGLSTFAAGEVGEIIHVELPKVGAKVQRGKPCAEIESVKSVNDFYSPVDGDVVEVNAAVSDSPELVNADPVGKGWFAKIKASGSDPLAGLLSDAEYQAKITK